MIFDVIFCERTSPATALQQCCNSCATVGGTCLVHGSDFRTGAAIFDVASYLSSAIAEYIATRYRDILHVHRYNISI